MFVLESVLTTSSFKALHSDPAGLARVSIAPLTPACCSLPDLLRAKELFEREVVLVRTRERPPRERSQLLAELPGGGVGGLGFRSWDGMTFPPPSEGLQVLLTLLPRS